MVVAFYEPYAINTPHYETCLELMQKYLDAGDKVILLYCNGDLTSCDVNKDHNPIICLKCISKRTNGLKLLNKKIIVKRLVGSGYNNTKEDFVNKFNDLNSLYYENFDVGYGVSSSIISMTRNPTININEQNKLIEKLIFSSILVYNAINDFLSKNDTDKLYIFSGRFCILRAALRACQKNNVDCYMHERGSNHNKYSLTKNNLLHEIKPFQERMQLKWETYEKENALIEAKKFYLARRDGEIGNWYSFTKTQVKGKLPPGFDAKKMNLGIFVSSEDEFAAIGKEWKNNLYESQLDGVRKIIRSIKNSKLNVHLYIRIHPNLKNVKKDIIAPWYELKNDFVDIISPQSDISSYTLLDNCDKILTFGSTIGIEASFWDKPSILCGNSFYKGLGSTYEPENHKEVTELILTSILKPLRKEGALKYGLYVANFGEPFIYYKPYDVFKGRFKRKEVSYNKLLDILPKVKLLRHFMYYYFNKQVSKK